MTTLITPLPTPPTRQDSANFNDRADEFLGALPLFQQEANQLAVEANANSQAAASVSNVTKWVSGITYQEGDAVWSPITGGAYRRITPAGFGNTDPSLDITNYKAITGAQSVLYSPPGDGAVATTVQGKLREFVSVKDFGASPSAAASANYTAIQSALNSGAKRVVVPADGDYVINAELIPPTGVLLEGQTGARIVQDTYGLSGVQLRNDYSGVKNLTIANLKTKTQLSTTVANRYDGEVQRSRAAGIYINAEHCVVEDVYCPGFINGINLVGGDRIWTTTSGTFTETTLVLNASSQQADNYYNGWTIRIFSTSNATSYVTVSDYDSAANTVTFPTVATFTGPYYYALIGPKHIGNRVYRYKGANNDFGILAQYQHDLVIDDIDQLSIEQTQELNARPHTVYVTDQVTSLRGARWRTNNCNNGHAYKFRAVTDAVLMDLSARNSRAVLAIEESSRFYVDGCIGVDIGTATFRPESANVTSSNDVFIENIKLRTASEYTYDGDSALRPAALVIGDPGFASVTNSIFRQIDSNCLGADQAFAVLMPNPSSGLHKNITIDGITTRGLGTYSGGATTPVLLRAFSSDSMTVSNLRHFGSDTPNVVLESSVTNATVSYESRRANPTITNSGTGNIIDVDGVETGAFTPVLYGATVAGTNTYSVQAGQYEKVGKVVTVRIRITLTSLTSSGSLRISGLPYTVAQMSGAVNMNPTSMLNNYSGITLSANNIPVGCAVAGQSRIDLYAASNTAFAVIDASTFSGTAAFQLCVTYIAA